MVAGVGQCPASASASRTAAQGAAGLLELRRVEAAKLTSVRSQDDTTGSNTTKTGEAGSFCVDVEICSARRGGAARASKLEQQDLTSVAKPFGTAGLGCTRSRLTVGVQDVVAGVGQSPASASASRTAAQELRGCKAEKSQSSKIDERQVAGRHDGLEYDKDMRSGVGSFCVDVEFCGAKRCGAARA